MNPDLLRSLDRHLLPLNHKVNQILKIGRVKKAQKKEGKIVLSIAISQNEELKNISLLSLNGLQRFPSPDDSVLVFCPEGRLEHAIAFAVISDQAQVSEKETGLFQGEQKIVINDHTLQIVSNRTLGAILTELLELISSLASSSFFIPAGMGVQPNPAKQQEMVKKISSIHNELERFS